MTAPPGQRIGPYRLGALVGTGGMGVVYAAEREGPDFVQRVALKLIRAGFADPKLEERLRRERRILARLEHPGIARFIDGGTTATGQSFFAMEFVEGTTLLPYCAEHALGVPARLQLFLQVADALHYAHQQLVVHGDLKPGNILVTLDGHAKLLDFGIAELLDAGAPAEAGPRSTPWLTPAYASPEQVHGERLTTLADVYSLGVVLYELLTGRLPYPVLGAGAAEVAQVIGAVEPVRPSHAVTDPGTRRVLAGDLDTILLTALAKEPGRRYASVAEFAADLRRHLDGEPVLARAPSARYRLGKFIRRHRASVAAAGLVLLSLVAGIAATAWQARVAGRERDVAEAAQRRAEQVSDFLVGLVEASDPRRSYFDSLAARSMLTEGLARVDRLDQEPLLQARMLDALSRIQMSFSDFDAALGLQQRALALRRATLGERHADVAASYEAMALTLRQQGRLAPAESLIGLALALDRAVLAPGAPALAHTLLTATNIAVALGPLDRAQVYAEEAYHIMRRVPPGQEVLGAEAIRVMGSVLRRRGQLDSAERVFREYVAYHERHFGPNSAAAALSLTHLGDLYAEALDRPAEAESLYNRSLALQAATLGPLHPSTVHARGSLAALLGRRGELERAESLYLANVEVLARSVGRESESTGEEFDKLSALMMAAGRPARARTYSERAVAARMGTGRGEPGLSASLGGLARAEAALGHVRRGLVLAESSLALRRRAFGDSAPQMTASYELLAALHAQLGHARVAESLYTVQLGVMRRYLPPDHPQLRRVQALLSGPPAEAERP